MGCYRRHRNLLNVTRSLLFHAKLPKSFWSFSLCHATFLINRLCSLIIQNQTPYVLLFKTPPTYDNIKTFGCPGYASTLTRQRDKLDPRNTKCIFLGFTTGIKEYLLFNLSTRSIFTTRNCVF